MMKKLMSLGLVGILSASLMVGCNSNSKDDDTVTIKYVDQNGNVKREKVTKDEAKQIERKQQTTDNAKDNGSTKEQTTKEQPKDEDDMTDDEMQEKGLIKKNGGHLEDEAKKQEKIHEQEDQEQQEQQQGKYPICYDEDGTQINDEYGNYTPEYEHKKEEQEKHQQYYDEDEDYPGKGILDPEDTTNTDNDVEETPSETIENN